MKGIYTARGNIGRLLSLLLFIVANVQALNADDRAIVIVKSSENAYFNQTIESLVNHADDHAHFKVLNSSNLDSTNDVLENANVIITLGADSANKISSRSPDQLVINAYITLEQATQFQDRNQQNIAVLLNQPLECYLAFSHYLLNLKTLGTINRFSPALNSRQLKILKNLNLKLNQYQLGDTNKNLLATVRQLIRKNEALLMLPEQSVYNHDTLKGILLTTYRSRIPVISYSPGHVKSGALAAIYSSPGDIGRHLANLINQRHEGRLNTNNKMVYAEYYSIATNQRVAHSLGLKLPSEEKLRQLIDETIK
jgi:ABC-type uncharacterized transport system substrate-binding protein